MLYNETPTKGAIMELEEQPIVYDGEVIEDELEEEDTVNVGALMVAGGLIVGAAIAVKKFGPSIAKKVHDRRLESAYKLIEEYTRKTEEQYIAESKSEEQPES